MKKTSLLGAMLLTSTPSLAPAVELPDARRPNVLVVMADDLGYGDLSITGSEDILTPNIERLARGGSTFSNAYITAPVCLPSRMAMLTGVYQQRFGVQTLPGPGGPRDYGLPADRLTLAERLRPAGYATGLVGKWHLGEAEPHRPNKRGFDDFFGFLGGSLPYFPDRPGVVWRNDRQVEKTQYMTDAFGEGAVDFINSHHERPFFLFFAFSAVHLPLEATEKYLALYPNIKDRSRRSYAAMTTAMDENIGLVLDALERNRILDDTLVLFLSDNGGFPRRWCDRAGYRGGKYELWEGGIRTPFVVSWKNGGVLAGRVHREMVSALDIVPTAMSAAGVKNAGPHELDGVDLLPLLRGQSDTLPRERLYWRYGPYQCAMREGDYKIIKIGVGDNRTPAWELYDLERDPGEKHDLALAQPDRLAAMTDAFEAWGKSLPEPDYIDSRLRNGIAWWQVKANQREPIRRQD